jgi:hypothetical protein
VVGVVVVREDRTRGRTVSWAVLVTPPRVAEIVCEVDCPIGVVVTTKLAAVAPAANGMDAGRVIPDELVERGMTRPPAGAGPMRVSRPVELWPPMTDAGAKVREDAAETRTGSWAALLTPPAVAVMVTTVVCPTGVVAMLKFACLPGLWTVTEGGTVTTAGLLLESWTGMPPPLGGSPVRVTVPPTPKPPVTPRLVVTEAGTGAETVSWAVLFDPPAVTLIVTTVDCVTGAVKTSKDTVVVPGRTGTGKSGTTAAGLSLESCTVKPCATCPLSVACPVDLSPPMRLAGLRVSEVGVCARAMSDPPSARAVRPMIVDRNEHMSDSLGLHSGCWCSLE